MGQLAEISEHNVGSSKSLNWGEPKDPQKIDFLAGSIAWDSHGPAKEGQSIDDTPWTGTTTTIYKADLVEWILTLPTTHKAPEIRH